VLVPRPVDQAGELAERLRAAGAEPVAVPLIAVVPPDDRGAFDLQLVDLADGTFDWVGFTSANAVRAVVQRAAELGLHPAIPADTRIAAVGSGTAAALRTADLPVDLVPTGAGSGAALGAVWPTARDGESVLLPRSDIARPGLPEALLAKGYRVGTVTAYRTVTQPLPDAVASELSGGVFHAILLTSPSTVTALGGVLIPVAVVLGAIGQPTALAAAAAGRPVTFVAALPTAAGLVAGLLSVAAARGPAAEPTPTQHASPSQPSPAPARRE
jgi:uroporphyrinogen-III synthase